MGQKTAKKRDKSVVYGRPRLLTHEEIIAGALSLGLETLTMKKLADHLGVGTATLYQYWNNRKELVQAAAVHALSDLDLPDDVDQHWALYCAQYCDCILSYLAQNPSLVLSNHAREYGFKVQFELVERFMAALAKRGFSAHEAMRLFNIVGMAAFAGAVEQVRQNDFSLHGEVGSETAQKQMDSLQDAEFPLMRQAIDAFTVSPEEKIRDLLELAFIGIAAGRGEDLSDVDLSAR